MNDSETLGLLLFLMGQFPLYIGHLNVEKHYTSFHTGFWNLYAASISIIGSAVIHDNLALLFVGILLGTFLMVVYESNPKNRNQYYSDAVRSLGSSVIASSVGWFVFIIGASGSLGIAILFGVLHFGFLNLNEEVKGLFFG